MDAPSPSPAVRLGLRENWKPFALLVLINALVGGMIGMERAILPTLAEEAFGLTSRSAMLSFITAFGLTKAIANYYTGRLANRWGRRRLLLLGWALAIPVPLMLIAAESWSWIIAANLLLGTSQGLTWSSTVVMKIDLVGERNRGLAMGINEFAGYFAVGLVALFTGYIAGRYGVTPYPFYIGIVLAVAGLLLTWVGVRDTRAHAEAEATASGQPLRRHIFWDTTYRDRILGSVTQAGLVNNLNDGMIWGLLPLLLAARFFTHEEMGWITGLYPAVWGIAQLLTGKMADHFSKRALLFQGMLLQGLAILWIPLAHQFYTIALLAAVLGLGTALVYPTFLTTIAAATHPRQRAESIGIFRLWRDLGYAIGAILSGLIADRFGLEPAIWAIGALTLLSAAFIRLRMPADRRKPLPAPQ